MAAWVLWTHRNVLILSGITLNGIVFGLLIPQSLPGNEEPTEEGADYSLPEDKKQDHCDSKTLTATDLNITPKEKTNLLSIDIDKSDYSSISGKASDNVSETNGYWRLLKNVYYILYSIGGILTFTVTKAVIGRYDFGT